jgi:cytochrome c5
MYYRTISHSEPEGPTELRTIAIALTIAGSLCAADAPPADFDSAVKPVLSKTCALCHNDKLSSGGLNVKL